ncbi:MAG: hypothetical protein A3J29_22480 [Acidobacteria bacterium RIFCSPLOWO2_12_FULL_67_14b]|nr:MAG: hypothetical protein A3J29_22480 [Acidobacteria bacterium RIFCSPLOWO2_12_FULL_67_14b]
MEPFRPVLLVVDDEPGILAIVARVAQAGGFEVVTRTRGQTVSELETIKADAALVDLRIPGTSGIEILQQIHAHDPACQVILMTGFASIDSAVEAVKLGALDYLSKPLNLERLGELLKTVQQGLDRRRRLMAADSAVAQRFEFCGMIGRSPAMQDLFDLIRRLAPHTRTALITGETGTGKELVAAALHKMGPRRGRRFVALNCSAIAETLFESELFGHARGAFTGAGEAKAGLFELADGGTLFLDEIGELPPPMQAKLLRVVEMGELRRVGATDERKVDVQVVAATNRSLRDEVDHGRFRQDLYYRLNVVEIALTPLRERREDIPYLTAAFVEEFAKGFGKRLQGLTPGAERLLQQADWAGNVRELRNTIERACILSEGHILSERDIASVAGSQDRPAPQPQAVPRPQIPLDLEQVRSALEQAGGNKAAAARALGLSRRAFYRRLETLGLR